MDEPLKKWRCFTCGKKLPSLRAELLPACCECHDGQRYLFGGPVLPEGFVPLNVAS